MLCCCFAVLLAIGIKLVSLVDWHLVLEVLFVIGFPFGGIFLLYFMGSIFGFLGSLFSRSKSHGEKLVPESDYAVDVDGETIRLKMPCGENREFRWERLTRVNIETNELGPYLPDVFWILYFGEEKAKIPLGAIGDAELLERMQLLPGFDNSAFTDAMGSTSEAVFEVWKKEEK